MKKKDQKLPEALRDLFAQGRILIVEAHGELRNHVFAAFPNEAMSGGTMRLVLQGDSVLSLPELPLPEPFLLAFAKAYQGPGPHADEGAVQVELVRGSRLLWH